MILCRYFPTPLPLLLAGIGALGNGSALSAQDLEEAEENDSGLPAMEMLVEGSILQKVLIPQYDEERRLSSTLRAAKLELVNDTLINATTVRIEFYHADQSLRGGIDLQTAQLQDQKILRSSEPVTLASGDLTAKGTGIVYELEHSRGFLKGPATATTLIDTSTSMNTNSPLRLGVSGLTMMAAAALHAQGLGELSDEELTGLDRLAVSKSSEAEAAANEASAMIRDTAEQSKAADQTLSAFLKKAAVEIKDGPKPDLTAKVADPELDKKMELPASIEAKEGIYFDSVEGLLVFLKDVEIDHPEFTLVGADEVKVFMEKAESKDAPKEKPDETEDGKSDEVFGSAKFGDPTRIVATGQVVVERKQLKPGDKKAKASGRQMLMDLKTNDLIIRGGEPWVISDTANGRVVDPNGYIRINLETGDASFVGDSKGFIETKR
ncbi:hypothetical protein HAHE_05270 [Haloferula helveola]|uniref:Organic solvent tolerance-like N-terminal domain-containing protein n=1 Tax=Haloferula helveola TaxID=490095 RepID=A0ABM7R8U6_9BACT|nr:hypothetical protein HAHE_05270 [Haloferula helveola]